MATKLTIQSAVDQVAAYLREHIASTASADTVPGGHALALELGVNHKTVEAALRRLEAEGVLISQGAGRPRRLATPKNPKKSRSLRIAILTMASRDQGVDYMIDLRHLLEESGHSPFYAEKSLLELGMDATRVSRFVKRSDAEAWVILAGSHEVLNWFSTHDTPAIALFGRHQSVSIASAGPDKVPPLRRLTQRLVDLGHRRITLLIRHHLRHPEPAPTARAFIEELEARDIHVGEFNLPDWDETSAGFQEILRSLFALTPPTAVITDEAFLFIAAHQFMAKRGIRVPEDVSLICTDSDPAFDWCEPSVAHIRWDSRPVVRRIVRWAEITSHGTDDRRKISTKAEFIDGGTLGPAR